MTFSTSDLTPLLQAAPTATVRYASGVIKSWNSESFENVVEVRGAELHNLPVLSGPDALTYKSGDVVALIGADQQGTRGIASYAILGRFVVPGTGKAEAAVEWMASELGRALAASVFADRIETGIVLDNESGAPDVGFGDLTTAGPTLDNIEVSEAGKLIVFVSARIGLVVTAGQPYVGVELTGPMTVPAYFDGSLHFGSTVYPDSSLSLRATSCVVYTDLPPGTYRVQAKYHGSTASFRDREVMSIAL